MSLDAALDRIRPVLDAALERALPDDAPSTLVDAMRYSLLAGGKRIRPSLVALSYEAAGGTGDDWLVPAVAVEMVHTYSLVHDDLPAMDDDDLRRGRPTCHRVYGDAVAILAGDALLTRAFELLGADVPDPALGGRLVAELGAAAGASGMVGGQVLDLAAEGAPRDQALAERIARLKTAALIRASARMGALAADATAGTLAALTVYGESVGLAFQLADDMLDLSSTAAELGKTPGKDVETAKLTVSSAIGPERARALARALVERAHVAIRDLPGARPLADLADFVLARRR